MPEAVAGLGSRHRSSSTPPGHRHSGWRPARASDFANGCFSRMQGAAADGPWAAAGGSHPMSRGIYSWYISRRRTMTQTAKLFMNGRSQAVRLPAEFRFSGREVLIERQGDAVILRPRPWGGTTSFLGRPRPGRLPGRPAGSAPEEREPF